MMNPQQQNHPASFELPLARTGEHAPVSPQAEFRKASVTETQATMAIEQGLPQQPAPAPQQHPQAMSSQSIAPAPPTQQQDPASTLAGASVPQIADDTDLIEKEWVVKAKEIVAKTANDPHLQSKEINRFKAEYLKKRYNKDLKLSDDS